MAATPRDLDSHFPQFPDDRVQYTGAAARAMGLVAQEQAWHLRRKFHEYWQAMGRLTDHLDTGNLGNAHAELSDIMDDVHNINNRNTEHGELSLIQELQFLEHRVSDSLGLFRQHRSAVAHMENHQRLASAQRPPPPVSRGRGRSPLPPVPRLHDSPPRSRSRASERTLTPPPVGRIVRPNSPDAPFRNIADAVRSTRLRVNQSTTMTALIDMGQLQPMRVRADIIQLVDNQEAVAVGLLPTTPNPYTPLRGRRAVSDVNDLVLESRVRRLWRGVRTYCRQRRVESPYSSTPSWAASPPTAGHIEEGEDIE
jgi:hypothetical protein